MPKMKNYPSTLLQPRLFFRRSWPEFAEQGLFGSGGSIADRIPRFGIDMTMEKHTSFVSHFCPFVRSFQPKRVRQPLSHALPPLAVCHTSNEDAPPFSGALA
jgi:hypothetical protein